MDSTPPRIEPCVAVNLFTQSDALYHFAIANVLNNVGHEADMFSALLLRSVKFYVIFG